MAIRVYICPWIGSGTKQDPYRSKATNYFTQTSSFFPSAANGQPASPWVLSVIRADDFSAIDADPACDDLFAGDLPQSVTSREDLLAFLRGRTVSQVPVARRNAITAVLDEYGVLRSDIVGTTTLWKVMQRVASTLFERDDNFGAHF